MASAAVEDHEDQDHGDQDYESKDEDKRPAKGFGDFLAGWNLGFGCLPELPVGAESCRHQFMPSVPAQHVQHAQV